MPRLYFASNHRNPDLTAFLGSRHARGGQWQSDQRALALEPQDTERLCQDRRIRYEEHIAEVELVRALLRGERIEALEAR